MKKIFLLTFLIFGIFAKTQVKIGSNPVVTPSAMLEVESSNKGFLPPRLTTAQRNAIPTPAIGLMIYNIDVKCIEWFTNTGWYTACNNPSAAIFPCSEQCYCECKCNLFSSGLFCKPAGL